tara:strand:+ start:269 stop:793 length:525 start_codon:yes stop_codon:yes gene_type:complete
MMDLNNLVRAAIFTSTAIGLGFVFMLIPNLEFISVTVFLAGMTLGFYFGAIVGGTSMLIYSVLNPLGSGLIYFPLLVSQILAMGVIGFLGASVRIFLFNLSYRMLIPISGILGFLSALWYDGVTTLAYPISAGYNLDEALAYAVSGILFTLMHIFSNTLIFSIVVPGYINRINN